jgi:hypothetical protein
MHGPGVCELACRQVGSAQVVARSSIARVIVVVLLQVPRSNSVVSTVKVAGLLPMHATHRLLGLTGWAVFNSPKGCRPVEAR